MTNVIMKEIRAEALFASDLQPSQNPAPDQVRDSVTATLRRYGHRWCAARMAQEYGEHPDTAIARMAWAVRTITDCYPAASAWTITAGRRSQATPPAAGRQASLAC